MGEPFEPRRLHPRDRGRSIVPPGGREARSTGPPSSTSVRLVSVIVNPDLGHLEPPLLSISAAAHLLSMSESTVRRLIDEDVIATVIVRGSVRIRRGELDPWLGAWSPVPVSVTPAGGRPPEPAYVVKSRFVGPGSGPESPNVPRGGVRPKEQAELERQAREAARLERTGPTVLTYTAEREAMHPSMRYADVNPDYDEQDSDAEVDE
ncbi:MAG: helix-turn-helix domain-containing protein [Thermoleophilia bacterium]